MNIDDYKCKGKEIARIICDGCEQDIYKCDECASDYFFEDNFVGCIPDGRHLCDVCFKEWIEQQDSELNAKQQLKEEKI